MKHKFFLVTCSLVCFAVVNAQVKKTAPAGVIKKITHVSGRLVEISTNYGNMIVKLYNETPQHRDNFIKLVKEGFYDSLLFHRVIEGFMIQGGDPTSKNADSAAMLGMGSAPGDQIPAEFNKHLIHKKGALAMARDDNPEKASSNSQFFIVQGIVLDDATINQAECNVRENDPAFYYSEAIRNTYKSTGGYPRLDQNYTVFGEVIKGLDVIDKIASVEKRQQRQTSKKRNDENAFIELNNLILLHQIVKLTYEFS